MKEDLSLYGNELNYATAVWSAAYIIGQVPSNLLLTRVNVPLYIAFLEFSWSAFTFAHAGAKSIRDIYVFRFLYVELLPLWPSRLCQCCGTDSPASDCSKPGTSRRSCMYVRVTTSHTSWHAATPSFRYSSLSAPYFQGSSWRLSIPG